MGGGSLLSKNQHMTCYISFLALYFTVREAASASKIMHNLRLWLIEGDNCSCPFGSAEVVLLLLIQCLPPPHTSIRIRGLVSSGRHGDRVTAGFAAPPM